MQCDLRQFLLHWYFRRNPKNRVESYNMAVIKTHKKIVVVKRHTGKFERENCFPLKSPPPSLPLTLLPLQGYIVCIQTSLNTSVILKLKNYLML